MKEEILKLREEGKTYNEIKSILGCSKSTISYYCGNNQKEKTRNRTNIRRENKLLTKLERFKARKNKNNLESIRKFQKRDNSVKGRVDKNIDKTFTWVDVIKKIGDNPICYLSGQEIDLNKGEYELDHIIPVSKNGANSLENLGVLHTIVNRMKSDLTPDELIEWCIKILTYNGYVITK